MLMLLRPTSSVVLKPSFVHAMATHTTIPLPATLMPGRADSVGTLEYAQLNAYKVGKT